LWGHSSHDRLIGRGVPGVFFVSRWFTISLFGLPQGETPRSPIESPGVKFLAHLQVAEQGMGLVLGSIAQAGSIVKMLQTHYAKAIAPLLEDVPQMAQVPPSLFCFV